MRTSIAAFLLLYLSFLSPEVDAQWIQDDALGSTFAGGFLAVEGTVYAACGTDGVISSTNGGASWISLRSNLSGVVRCVWSDGPRLYAGANDGLYSSDNNGASWTKTVSGLTNTTVTSLTSIGSDLFAGTAGSGVYLSTDRGSNWTAINSGLPPNGIALGLASSGTNLFVALMDTGVFRSTNYGTSWSPANEGLPAHSAGPIVVGGASLFTYSSGEGVFRSTDNGTTWNKASSGITDLNIGSLAASGDRIIAGIFGGGVFVSTDNGASWSSPNPAGAPKGIVGVGVAGSTFFASGGGVFRSTDGGTNWHSVNSGLKYNAANAFAALGNSLFAATDAGIFHSTESNPDWTFLPHSLIEHAVSALSSDGSRLYLGKSNGAFVSTNSGLSWEAAGLYSKSVLLLTLRGGSLYANGPDGLFVSTDAGRSWTTLLNTGVFSFAYNQDCLFAGTEESGVLVSKDGGATWDKTNTDNLTIRSIATLSSRVFACNNWVVVSTDNGASWSSANVGLRLPGGGIQSLTVGGNNLFGCGASGVYLTTNGGASWKPVGLEATSVNCVFMNGKDIYAGTATQGIWHRRVAEIVPAAHVEQMVTGTGSVSFNTPDNVSAVSINFSQLSGSGAVSVARFESPALNATFNGTAPAHASSYRWVISQTGLSGLAAEVSFDLDDGSFAVVNPSTVTVYARPDSGAEAFTALPTTYDPSTNQLKVTVASFSEFIFGSADNPLTGTELQGQTAPGNFTLLQCYPNPFNPSTRIKYTVGGTGVEGRGVGETGAGGSGLGTRKTRLVVYDLLGRQVATLVDEWKAPGSYEVRFDGSGLSSGLYIYRLTSGPFVGSRTMMLVK